MVENDAFLDIVGYSPQMKIMGAFITGRDLDYSATGIINAAEVGRATFYAVFPHILKQGLAVPTRKVGNIQLYTLNHRNPAIKHLMNLYKQALKGVIDKYLPAQEKASVKSDKKMLVHA